jgi:hypothetical protein
MKPSSKTEEKQPIKHSFYSIKSFFLADGDEGKVVELTRE